MSEPDRMAAMLSGLAGRGYRVQEDQRIYGDEGLDFDPDPASDFNFDINSSAAGNQRQCP